MSKLPFAFENNIKVENDVCAKCILGGHSNCLGCDKAENHYAYCETCEKRAELADLERDNQLDR